jgi:hypothetical protein
MKQFFIFLAFACLLSACKTDKPSAWKSFTSCPTNACVHEVLAVKDALLANPAAVLSEFQKTYEKGEDHVVGWMYILRDSVLTNPAHGTLEARLQMRDKVVAAVTPYLNEKTFGEMARNVKDEMDSIAMMAETEEDSSDEFFPVTGTYQLGDGKEGSASGVVKAAWTNAEDISFDLEVVSGGKANNMGKAEGLAKRTGPNTYTWTTSEYNGTCTISFTFLKNSVSVKTLAGDPSSCGFGNAVVPDGNYQKTNHEHPFLKSTYLRMAQKLEGEWVSASDPKSNLKLMKGVFEEWYDGKLSETFPYQFHATCPEDCGKEQAKFPCYTVYGQDIACMAVVKVDNSVLEVSPVGGRGNTLKYQRVVVKK